MRISFATGLSIVRVRSYFSSVFVNEIQIFLHFRVIAFIVCFVVLRRSFFGALIFGSSFLKTNKETGDATTTTFDAFVRFESFSATKSYNNTIQLNFLVPLDGYFSYTLYSTTQNARQEAH